jgi:aerobic-type carbon monoxide dehydrogenase small subunit (CoxS/CutS family)
MFRLKINVNGVDHEREISPQMRLLDFIRNDLGLTGTKEGCGEGECGACTVIVDGAAIDSCLMLAAQCHGKRVETIEGLEKGGVLHPVQKAFLENGAVQCGFCIPGMVLSAKALLDGNPDPSDEEVKACVSGNLCRCTGYDKMFTSIKEAKKAYSGEGEK